MDHQSAGIKFGAIGHQENWDKVLRFVNAIRDLKAINALSLQQIKEVYGFIPSRPLFDVNMKSMKNGNCKGVYIESFIAPDELDPRHLRSNLSKVKDACHYAASLKIPVVSLGGFTSIILESSGCDLRQIGDTHFTTGNTMTAGFIVKAVERACLLRDLPIEKSTVMIIGSTGDIGSACTKYFAGKSRGLILCARHKGPLEEQAISLLAKSIDVNWSTDINKFLSRADIVISVASSILEKCEWSLLPSYAIICDAGYPKNLSHSEIDPRRIFYGGMGRVEQGFSFEPDYAEETYRFPVPYIVHGCLLEAIVLAMEGTPKSLSTGRGNISIEAMETMIHLAAAHGVYPAPLFNGYGLLEKHHQPCL